MYPIWDTCVFLSLRVWVKSTEEILRVIAKGKTIFKVPNSFIIICCISFLCEMWKKTSLLEWYFLLLFGIWIFHTSWCSANSMQKRTPIRIMISLSLRSLPRQVLCTDVIRLPVERNMHQIFGKMETVNSWSLTSPFWNSHPNAPGYIWKGGWSLSFKEAAKRPLSKMLIGGKTDMTKKWLEINFPNFPDKETGQINYLHLKFLREHKSVCHVMNS